MGIRNKITGEFYSIAAYDPSTGNVTGITNTGGNTDLGNVSNVYIEGGVAGDVLATDGTGNLSWVAQGGAGSYGNAQVANYLPTYTGNLDTVGSVGNGTTELHGNGTGIFNVNAATVTNGTSNVAIPVTNSDVVVTAGGTQQWTFDTTGNLTVPGSIVGQPNAFVNLMSLDNGDGAAVTMMNWDVANSSPKSIVQASNDVVIATNITGSPFSWTFGANGTLAAPGGITLPSSIAWPGGAQVYEDSGLAIESPLGIGITSPGATQITANGSHQWTFGTDGSTTFPNGSKLNPGTPYQFATDNGVVTSLDMRDTSGAGFYTNTSGYTLRADGIQNWQFGTDSTLTVPGGIYAQEGNDLRVRVFNPDVTGGVTYVVQNYQVDIGQRTTQFEVTPTDITLATDFSGNRNQWTFAANGVSVFPGDLISTGASPAPSINGFESANFYGNVTANIFVGDGGYLSNVVASAGGSNTQIQFNNDNALGASANLTFVDTVGGGIVQIGADLSLLGNGTVTSPTGNLYLQPANALVVTAGSSDWVYDITGNLTLPQGGSLYSLSTTPSGAPGNTIILQPAGSGVTTDQRLLVYPTAVDGDHIHLTSGNLYQSELFLGSDDLFVKLANTGNIVMHANDNVGNTATWTLGALGTTTFPSGATLVGTPAQFTLDPAPIETIDLRENTGTGFYTNSGQYILRANGAYSWVFDATGNLLVPEGNTHIKSVGNDTNSIGLEWDAAGAGNAINSISANANGTYITTASDAYNNLWQFDVTGNLTLPGNTFTVNYANGTQVSLGGGAGSSISNGTSNVSVALDSNITLSTSSGTATLDTSNNLTIPGNLQGIFGSYVQPNFIQPNSDDGEWAFGLDGDGTSQFWMQAKFFGGSESGRGFRVFNTDGGSIPFWVDGLGNTNANGNMIANYFYGDGSNIANLIGSNVTGSLTGPTDISIPGDIVTTASIYATLGTISGQYLAGDGSNITGIPLAYAISNATSNVSIPVADGPILMFDGGVPVANISPSQIAIGGNAQGAGGSGANAIAIGALAGNLNQGQRSVAVGQLAGSNAQGIFSVAVGRTAGQTTQGSSAVAIGSGAGATTQGQQSVAIGDAAGGTTQGGSAVAIGRGAATTTQGNSAVAIGSAAAGSNQGLQSIAIGFTAGQASQGANAIAIGSLAGGNSQSANAIAIGWGAGQGNTTASSFQGANSIAIGMLAGNSAQTTNSIILNASGVDLPATNSGLYVAPVRNDTGNTTNAVFFNSSTKEVTYATTKASTIAAANTVVTLNNITAQVGGTPTRLYIGAATSNITGAGDTQTMTSGSIAVSSWINVPIVTGTGNAFAMSGALSQNGDTAVLNLIDQGTGTGMWRITGMIANTASNLYGVSIERLF